MVIAYIQLLLQLKLKNIHVVIYYIYIYYTLSNGFKICSIRMCMYVFTTTVTRELEKYPSCNIH